MNKLQDCLSRSGSSGEEKVLVQRGIRRCLEVIFKFTQLTMTKAKVGGVIKGHAVPMGLHSLGNKIKVVIDIVPSATIRKDFVEVDLNDTVGMLRKKVLDKIASVKRIEKEKEEKEKEKEGKEKEKGDKEEAEEEENDDDEEENDDEVQVIEKKRPRESSSSEDDFDSNKLKKAEKKAKAITGYVLKFGNKEMSENYDDVMLSVFGFCAQLEGGGGGGRPQTVICVARFQSHSKNLIGPEPPPAAVVEGSPEMDDEDLYETAEDEVAIVAAPVAAPVPVPVPVPPPVPINTPKTTFDDKRDDLLAPIEELIKEENMQHLFALLDTHTDLVWKLLMELPMEKTLREKIQTISLEKSRGGGYWDSLILVDVDEVGKSKSEVRKLLYSLKFVEASVSKAVRNRNRSKQLEGEEPPKPPPSSKKSKPNTDEDNKLIEDKLQKVSERSERALMKTRAMNPALLN